LIKIYEIGWILFLSLSSIIVSKFTLISNLITQSCLYRIFVCQRLWYGNNIPIPTTDVARHENNVSGLHIFGHTILCVAKFQHFLENFSSKFLIIWWPQANGNLKYTVSFSNNVWTSCSLCLCDQCIYV